MQNETGILTKKIRIDGMTCVNCQNRIERQLRSTTGIENAAVSYTAGTATVTYNTQTITIQEIVSIIERLDYSVPREDMPGLAETGLQAAGDTRQPGTGGAAEKGLGSIGTLVIIFAVFMLLQHFGFISFFNSFPLAEAGMGYGMIFLIGVVTSVHCIAMCGGINLSQSLGAAAPTRGAMMRPALLYNLGRVISYTFIGAIVGALGQVISFSGSMQGIVQLAAGVFMIIMGINMLGLFPALRRFAPHLPAFFGRKIDEVRENGGRRVSGARGPLFIGLLNGLMPCGPLQAMQLYALSTGSPLKGGLSMLLFSLGTTPLMFGLGAASSFLSKTFTKKIMTVGAMLVVILGLSMFSNGWNLGGLPSPLGMLYGSAGQAGRAALGNGAAQGSGGAVIENGVQVVNSSLSSGRYPAITVQQGIPVKWNINAPAGSINGCNNRMIIREYGIEHRFSQGDNLIEFTPAKTGTFRYSCWMGMIRSSITVVAQGADIAGAAAGEDDWGDYEDELSEPEPAGFRIPTGEIGLARMEEQNGRTVQLITIDVTDRGFVPAAVVIQNGILAGINFNNVSTRTSNYMLRFPDYGQEVLIEQGENILGLLPQG
ncbi:MAG: sulfite exporter TauE/SafE family protein, partial [Treponema sp.]|nr:sulfite exporter TauE/SafE family protein [Treponema sp.]